MSWLSPHLRGIRHNGAALAGIKTPETAAQYRRQLVAVRAGVEDSLERVGGVGPDLEMIVVQNGPIPVVVIVQFGVDIRQKKGGGERGSETNGTNNVAAAEQ